MITKEQQLVLNSKGYDLVFEWKGKLHAFKSESLAIWDEKKKAKFRQETGLDFAFIRKEWVFFNPEQFEASNQNLQYISKEKKPDQPINCTKYYHMFFDYDGELLDLSHWDVSKITEFDYMFYGCKNLKSLDLTGWDTSSCSLFHNMFSYCKSLRSLELSSWDVSKCEDFSSMFCNCCSLEFLDVSCWCVDNASSFFKMFYGCKKLHSLDLSSWNVSRCKDFTAMFSTCHNLESLNLSNWDVSGNNTFNSIFSECQNLKSLDLSGWCISEKAWNTLMFEGSGIEQCLGKPSDELEELLKQGKWPSSIKNCI